MPSTLTSIVLPHDGITERHTCSAPDLILIQQSLDLLAAIVHTHIFTNLFIDGNPASPSIGIGLLLLEDTTLAIEASIAGSRQA